MNNKNLLSDYAKIFNLIKFEIFDHPIKTLSKKYNIPKNKIEYMRRKLRKNLNYQPKQYKDLTGQSFGMLKVIKFSHRDSGGYPIWLCLCECGNEAYINGGSLTRLFTRSCGCSWHKIGNKHHSWTGYGEINGTFWKTLLNNAQKKQREFNITPEFIWNLFLKQRCKCALSGVQLVFGYQKNTASLDRIDSSKGYTKGNVQWVHKDVNSIKGKMSDLELIDWAYKISNFQYQNEASSPSIKN